MSTDAATTAVVLVAHGSRADAANAEHRHLAETLARRTERTVVPAFLELAEPSIEAAISEAVERGASRVVVLPYFLSVGRHVAIDIPQAVEESATNHPAVDIELRGHLGGDHRLLDVLAALIDGATHAATGPRTAGA